MNLLPPVFTKASLLLTQELVLASQFPHTKTSYLELFEGTIT